MDEKREKSPSSTQATDSQTPDESGLEKLAESLRAKYADIRDEPIPETLKNLVEALREAEKKAQTRH